MPDFYKTFGKDVQLEAPQEFCMAQPHFFWPVGICIIPVFKQHTVLADANNPMGGNSNFVGVAPGIIHYIGHSTKRTFSINVPFFITGLFDYFLCVYALQL